MTKSKKKFLLTSLALAVPLVVTITSACSEIGLTSPKTPETQSGTETK